MNVRLQSDVQSTSCNVLFCKACFASSNKAIKMPYKACLTKHLLKGLTMQTRLISYKMIIVLQSASCLRKRLKKGLTKHALLYLIMSYKARIMSYNNNV